MRHDPVVDPGRDVRELVATLTRIEMKLEEVKRIVDQTTRDLRLMIEKRDQP